MERANPSPYIETVKEKCRVCYTCVRECPAKAIRIENGQAEVLADRCIGCGNCVRVCSQNAKTGTNTKGDVRKLLASDEKVAAVVAPSFPVEFPDMEYPKFVGALRKLGFDYVNEVAFGADLVAERYRRLVDENKDKRYIATTCPALIFFVEKYHPGLVDSLAPIVSPMIAIARALHQLHDDELKIVFIGPCIAKKAEAKDNAVENEIDAVITFQELHEMFQEDDIDPKNVEDSEFDPPTPGLGALFPISKGLLQSADIKEDLLAGDIVAADGRKQFTEAIKEFESGALDARLLEVLCCNGCIMGAGTTSNDPLFRRRSRVSQYVRKRVEKLNFNQWHVSMQRFKDLDLSRTFEANDSRVPVPSQETLREILERMGKFEPEDELNCGACGYETCRDHAIAIYKGLAESEMCLPYTIEKLKTTISELANTQHALMQSEKLASMGQLAAGVAHEVNNPLGVVLLYAHMLLDECDPKSQLKDDLKLIVDQADRCKKIVSGLLNFARQKKVALQTTDITELIDRFIKTIPIPDNVKVEIEHESKPLQAEVDSDQITQVITNLVNNAIDAMSDGGNLTIQTQELDDEAKIIVKDTGTGIPEENMKKLFEPFFTTKQMGKGTGLGLAVTYGIIKMHNGSISVNSNTDPEQGETGTEFIIKLPKIGLHEESPTVPEMAEEEQEDLLLG